MEIERKFLISKENLPADLDAYPHHKLEQGYFIHRTGSPYPQRG